MSIKILGLIPARYASSRLPGKALEDISGKSMIRRVYEQALKCKDLTDVYVATDHEDIRAHMDEYGGNVLMTDPDHQSGTDRCAEAIQNLNTEYDYVINIQGDEPFIDPEQISQLASVLDGTTQLATLIQPLHDPKEILDPNLVKVIRNKAGEAIYFSRNKIPYERNPNTGQFFKHIGIYAYREDILREITQLPPSSLEKAESLEQLRWIENGYRIMTVVTEIDSFGIDTYEDLEKARGLAKN